MTMRKTRPNTFRLKIDLDPEEALRRLVSCPPPPKRPKPKRPSCACCFKSNAHVVCSCCKNRVCDDCHDLYGPDADEVICDNCNSEKRIALHRGGVG